VPDSADGTHWAVVFFESIPDSLPPKGKIGLIMSGRVGTIVYVTPGGTEKKQCEFTSLAYRRAGYQKHEFILTLNNTGNTFIRPKGKLTILDDKEKALDEQPLPEEVVLPGAVRQFKLVLNKILLPGKYKIVADVDLGLREILQGERAFEVTP
jgi:hypothetical protein